MAFGGRHSQAGSVISPSKDARISEESIGPENKKKADSMGGS